MTAGGGTHTERGPDGPAGTAQPAPGRHEVSDPDAVWAPPPAPTGESGPSLLPGYSGFTEVTRGGDSVIYRATQDALGRLVAVKAVELADPTTRARFDRELQITLGLGRQHPHVVTVLDTGETTDGRAAIVMEYYELGSLHDRLVDHGPLPVVDALRVAAAVADALAFAHRHGVLHRDVKPQNVLALPTTYVLADFGIARMADAGHTASLERFSYRHASPQVLDGQAPTVADDVWSFGSTIFTVLEGRTPFSSDDEVDDTALAYIGRVRRGERRPWRRTEVPATLRALVDRCLAPVPGDRPSEMAAVFAEVEGISATHAGWGPGAASAAPSVPAAPPAALAQDDVDASVAAAPVADATPTPVVTEPEPLVDTVVEPVVEPEAEPATEPVVEASAATAFTATDPLPAAAYEEPAPLAKSALAHDPGPAVARDAEPTGRAAAGPPATPDAPEDTGRLPSRWRIMAFVTAALLLGITGGILTSVLGGRDDQDTATPPATTTTGQPVPTVSVPSESVTTDSDGTFSDPAFTPGDFGIVDQGNSLRFSWTDPTEGQAQFVLVDVTGGKRASVTTVTPGSTSVTVEGIDPQGKRLCYQLVAIVTTAQTGSTVPTCIRG